MFSVSKYNYILSRVPICLIKYSQRLCASKSELIYEYLCLFIWSGLFIQILIWSETQYLQPRNILFEEKYKHCSDFIILSSRLFYLSWSKISDHL